MKTLVLCFASLACFPMVGCTGGIIASGKRYQHLLKPETTVSEVRKSLGEPAWSETYNPPIAIKDTKAYRRHYVQGRKSGPFIGSATAKREAEIASTCDVYSRKGPYADPERAQAYGMAFAMTLGVSELVLVPQAIGERSRMGQEHYSLTFWYDPRGNFIGYYRGDIRQIAKPKNYTR